MTVISIIVPVYRVEDYLETCIQSIQSQTYKHWELILVDDGSPDLSGIICDKYAKEDDRIKVVHLPNGGVSKARNTGLEIATGKYICFIDSDDWVEPTYIESMIKLAGDSDTVVYSNVVNDYADGKESKVLFNYSQGKSVILSANPCDLIRFKILENGFPIAKLFEKSIIDNYNIRFDEDLSYHEDHLFVLCYLSHVNRVMLCCNADYHYIHRIGNNSLSKRKHTASKLIDASNKLLMAVEQGNKRWRIYDSGYLNRLYTYLGLNQLMLALAGSTSSEVQLVANAMREHMTEFRKYYSPNHRLIKLIPLLIQFRFEILYKLVLRWKEKLS